MEGKPPRDGTTKNPPLIKIGIHESCQKVCKMRLRLLHNAPNKIFHKQPLVYFLTCEVGAPDDASMEPAFNGWYN